jgi:hypothetical protein
VPDVKKTIFTFITVVVVPLLFFGLLELGLMAAGVGTSFNYFRKIDIDGITHYQDNPDFADQFYPKSLNIDPRESTFSAESDPERLRVYILGGSAALGFPHKNHGVDRLLETQLRAALPSRKIEVINLAMTSINSHVVYAIARSIPKGSADFAVILMGNNEVVGPYGPGTLNQNFLHNITLIRSIQSLKRRCSRATPSRTTTRAWPVSTATTRTIFRTSSTYCVTRGSTSCCPRCPSTCDTRRLSCPFTTRT